LNTNDCSFEASPTLATGRESPPPPLKKGGIGNVPVVGDGSDWEVDKRTGDESNSVVGLSPGGMVR
jgi:hypothetical protein